MPKNQKELIELEKQRLQLQEQQAKNFNTLIEKALPLVEKYFTTRLEKLEAPKFKISSIIFSTILLVIVIGSGVLVFYGKITSDNFTFLIGVIVGYLMTFIKNIVMIERED